MKVAGYVTHTLYVLDLTAFGYDSLADFAKTFDEATKAHEIEPSELWVSGEQREILKSAEGYWSLFRGVPIKYKPTPSDLIKEAYEAKHATT